MYWNYVVADHGPEHDEDGARFEIVEVYYDNDNNLFGYAGTGNLVTESVEDLKDSIENMLDAFDHPMLNIKELFKDEEIPIDNWQDGGRIDED